MNNHDFELLNNTNKFLKVYMISVYSDNNIIHILY